ncbi:hypothetical protein TKK_0001087 [Trichogramma kaykai]|uniref:Amino acid transporter transmembrane domain-containing protein n=1 Tax=Trichogramma kaykai TaxID=54128 RepID=A0ABD2WT34_9HYME
MPLFLVLATLPDLTWITPFSALGWFGFVTGFFSSFYFFLSDVVFLAPELQDEHIKPFFFPVYCCIFLFSMYNLSVLIPLENKMKHPSKLPVILFIVMMICVIINTIFAFLGYNKYPKTCDTVIKNLPKSDSLALYIKIAICVSVVCTWPIQFYALYSTMWPMMKNRLPDKWTIKLIFRLVIALISLLVGVAIPKLSLILGLFSTIGMTSMVLLIPILIETATKWEHLSSTRRILMSVKNLFMIFVWFILLAFGLYQNIMDLVEEFTGQKQIEFDDIC